MKRMFVLAMLIACGSYGSGLAASSGGSAGVAAASAQSKKLTYSENNIAGKMLETAFGTPTAQELCRRMYDALAWMDDKKALYPIYRDLFKDVTDVTISLINVNTRGIQGIDLIEATSDSSNYNPEEVAMGVSLYVNGPSENPPTQEITNTLDEAVKTKWSEDGPRFDAKVNQGLWAVGIEEMLKHVTDPNNPEIVKVEEVIKFLAQLATGRSSENTSGAQNLAKLAYQLSCTKIAEKLTENPEKITELREMLTKIADDWEKENGSNGAGSAGAIGPAAETGGRKSISSRLAEVAASSAVAVRALPARARAGLESAGKVATAPFRRTIVAPKPESTGRKAATKEVGVQTEVMPRQPQE